MPTIQEIRSKYPQYDDMSDMQLADALHTKYYSDIPKDQYYEKIGMKQPSNEMGFLNKLPRNIAAGTAELGRNLLNIPAALHLPYAERFEPFNYGSALGIKEPTLADSLIQSLAQYAPGFAIPGVGLGRAGQAISKIPKVGSFLSEAASQAIPQGLFGATQHENPIEGFQKEATGAAIGTGIGRGIEKVANKLLPANLFKTPLSKKELVRAYQQTKGTNTDIGNLIDNPTLQKLYENKLVKYSSEPYGIMQKTAEQVTNRGSRILSKLLGEHSPEDIPEKLTESLLQAHTKHRAFKNDIYNAVDDLAQKENLKLALPNFAKKAQNYMAAIEDTNILKHEPESRAILNKLINYAHPVKEIKKTGAILSPKGEPLINIAEQKFPTLKEANILKGKLGHYAKIFGESSDPAQRNMSGIFHNLSRTLKGDIESSIESSGNDVLKKGYQVAEENYKKNYSPFLDKDIYKFISGKAHPETLLNDVIRGGSAKSQTRKLKALTNLLPEKSREPIAYNYLAGKAIDNEGNLNPAKLAAAIKNLGSKQMSLLFPDKALRKQLLDYKTLVQKNKEPLYVMFNPKTGQRNTTNPLDVLGAILGAVSHGTLGGIVGAIGTHVAANKGAKYAAKGLTDENIRRKLVKSLVAGKDVKMKKTKEVLSKAGAYLNQ